VSIFNPRNPSDPQNPRFKVLAACKCFARLSGLVGNKNTLPTLQQFYACEDSNN